MAPTQKVTDDEEKPAAIAVTPTPLALIWPLLGRHIAFHRRLVDLTGNVKAALLLSQSLYWTRHGRDIAVTDGWFWKTAEQWKRETGLSTKEQATARDLLRDQALVEELRIGIPARLHFRLRVDELGMRLSHEAASRGGGGHAGDGRLLAQLLGPSLAFHRTLAEIAGGVHAGLMLSRAVHLTKLKLRSEAHPWICNSAAQLFQDVGLTRREQQTARQALLSLGVWEETLRGIPPSMMARLRLDTLLALLTARAIDRSSEDAVDREVPRPAGDLVAQIGNSSLWESHIHVLPKAQNQICRKRHHSFAESAILLINKTTTDLLQPHSETCDARVHESSSGGAGLIIPERLIPEEHAAARAIVGACPDVAQALLDELDGRLKVGAPLRSPLAYLRGLVRRARSGRFVPELGLRVAAQRRRREMLNASSTTDTTSQLGPSVEPSTPDAEQRRKERRDSATRHIGDLRRLLRADRRGVPEGP